MAHPAQELKILGLKPKKRFGQNFLLDMSTLTGAEKLFSQKEKLLEIGPGLGMVTEYFTRLGFSMLLIEKDRVLAEYLKKKYPQHEVICNDFLEVKAEFLETKKITQVVGNLPFYITTPILEKLVKEFVVLKKALLGMQKEVAQRIVQVKGSSLGLFMRYCGKSQIFRHVSQKAFYPIPQVGVSWLFWERENTFSENSLRDWEIFLRALFWGKRKTLKTTLKNNPFLSQKLLPQEIPKKLNQLFEDPKFKELWQKRSDALSFSEVQTLFSFLFDGKTNP